MNWSPFPLLRIALLLAAGIFTFEFFGWQMMYAGPLFIVCCILYLIYEQLPVTNPGRKSLLSGALLLSIVFLTGGLRLCLKNKELDDTLAILESSEPIVIHGRISERLKSETKIKFCIEVDYVSKDGVNTIPCRSDLIAVFDGTDSMAAKYVRGNHLYLHTATRQVRKNSNPLAFDYSYYLRTKGIVLQTFVKPGTHKADILTGDSFFYSMANHVTNFAKTAFARYLVNDEQKGTAESIMLGDRFLLTENLYQAYSDTGAIHVLSVSGLHVAIFISIFIWLFSRIPDSSFTIKASKLIFLLTITWFYVVLTGIGPSVTRSGIMVSVYLIGKALDRNTSNYNILAASAVAMLFWDPMYLFQVSFQFSYISLLSILYFQPLFKSLFLTKNRVAAFVWDLIIVSVAAQVMIYPFTTYYFHQFPVYFALSGIFAVPLVTIIIYVGTLLVAAEYLMPKINMVIAPVFRFLIDLLNQLIQRVSDLPHAKLEDLWISQDGLLLMVFFIMLLMLWLETRNRPVFYAMLTLAFLVVAETTIRSHVVRSKADLVIYDVGGGAIVDAYEGGTYRTFRVGDVDDANTKFAATNRRIWSACDPPPSEEAGGVICHAGKTIYISGTKEDFQTLACRQKVDILVVSGFGYNDPEDLIRCLSPHLVVLDRNLSRRKTEKWQTLQQELMFGIHNIKTDGAFSLSDAPQNLSLWEQ